MADVITVKSGLGDSRVALWERHPDHPDGEVFIAGDRIVQVARTSEVSRRLKDGMLVETDEQPAQPAEEEGPLLATGEPDDLAAFAAEANANEIVARLPHISDDGLTRLAAYEEAHDGRVTVLRAISQEQDRRAQAQE